jgi:hypothetical protein
MRVRTLSFGLVSRGALRRRCYRGCSQRVPSELDERRVGQCSRSLSCPVRQHAPQIEAAPLRARGTEAGEGGAVVGAEDGVAEEIRHADGHDLVKHVGRHLGVEREEDDTPLDVHTGDGD